MNDIRQSINQLPEPDKSLQLSLIEFYETMKSLENDSHMGGKQATKIIMTSSDIKEIFKELPHPHTNTTPK